MAKLHIVAIAHYDATVDEVSVDVGSIAHLGEEEIGIGRINLLADGQLAERHYHSLTLHNDSTHPLL